MFFGSITWGSEMILITDLQMEEYADVLRAHAVRERLERVHIFGGVSISGKAAEPGIIVEVPGGVFLRFAGKCIGAFDGYHPILKQLLPKHSPYLDYLPLPGIDRFTKVLSTVGITSNDARHELNRCVPDRLVDMLCLPKGWEEPGYVDGLLAQTFGFPRNPQMLGNIKRSARVV
ncbi:MAG: hypothetical protein NUW00_00515 [Candidatus Kaiserbacteria bacterium]|nr:hypothetical protein [Candidatus Kaiserbacteria bacterium]